MSKLDNLCAIKVMGWHIVSDIFWYEGANDTGITISFWRPSKSISDALVCLERAVGEDKWNCGKWSNGDNKVKYYCEIHRIPSEGAYGETLALAMCRAALRAMGVPESEISIAMEE